MALTSRHLETLKLKSLALVLASMVMALALALALTLQALTPSLLIIMLAEN